MLRKHNNLQNDKLNDPSPLGQALREMSAFDVMETIPCAIFAFQLTGEKTASIPFASRRLRDLTGIDAQEAMEDADALLKRIHPEEMPPFFAAANESAQTLSPWHQTLRIDHPEKKTVWLKWCASPALQDESVFWWVVLHDISEQKKNEAELEYRKQEFRSLAESFPDSFIHYDHEGRMCHLNEKLKRDLGVTDSEVLGKLPIDVWPDGRFASIDQAIRQALDHGIASKVEFWQAINTPDAHFHQIHVVPQRDSDGRITGVFAFGYDLTELKRNSQFLRTMINALPDLVWLKDKEGTYLMCNSRFERFFGASEAEITGKSDYDFIDRELADQFRENDRIAMESGIPRINEELVTFADDGHQELLETIKTPMRDMPGEVNGVLGISRNITARKRIEDVLRFIANPGNMTGSDGFLRALTQFLGEKLEIRYVLIDILTDDPSIAQTVALYADGDIVPNIRYELKDTPCHNVIGKRVCCYPRGIQSLFPNDQLLTEMNAESYAGIPLWDSSGQPIGLVAVIDDKPFTDEESLIYILQLASPRIATELERERNEKMLRRREREFRTLAENSPDNIIRYDTECRQIYANPSVVDVMGKLLGRNPIGETPNEAYPDGSFKEYEAALRRVISTGEMEDFEFVLPDRGNGTQYHMIRMAAEKNSVGEIIGAIAFGRNITTIRERKRKLYLLEYAMERMLDGSILVDRQGTILDVNHALCSMLGYEKGDLIARPLFEITPEFSQANWDDHWESVVRAGGVAQIETFNRTRDNRSIPTEVSINIFRFEGKDYNLAIIRNITERREATEQLRMAASVFEAAREGIIITDPRGDILKINPAFSQITGYQKNEAIGRRPNLLASGQHDRAFYETMWSSLTARGAWSGEIVNRRKNGEFYSERLDIVAVNDDSGSVKHYIGIFSDISQLKQHEKHLQHIAHHDALTGLPNRLLLTDRLSMAIAQARRSGQMLAILYLDLDGFKPINDEHGHEFGDRVLVEIAQRLSASLRASDTVARIGGDEFVALLAGISDTGECEFTSHRLLEVVSRPIVLDGHTLNLTVSIGIALYPGDEQEDADILLRYADQAMYFAKGTGRNHFVFFDSCAHEKRWNQNQTIHDLRQALHQKRIAVYYQPIVDLESGKMIKAEALVRWHHPALGTLLPSEFIPVAENGGLIHEIGDLVFREATRVARTWNDRNVRQTGELIRISINRSPRQFFKPDSVDVWAHYLSEQGISGTSLVVEITEGLLLDDRPEVLQQLEQLRSMGIAISLDDFGTGYSALSYLKKFNIDYIKIDRSFIRDIAKDPDDRAIVESIIVMAKRLGIKVVAEGVETTEQADLLRNAGCDMAQGYLYAKPLPEEEFLEFVFDDPRSVSP